MKPHSLQKVTPNDPVLMRSPNERFAALGPHAKRFGRVQRDANGKKCPLPETAIPFCPRVKMADLPPNFIPRRLYERNLEQNQLIASCCRHPENHEISAEKSHPDEPVPDRYNFHCQCGRTHRVFCVGTGDERPMWKAA